jgi:hypothetical protein
LRYPSTNFYIPVFKLSLNYNGLVFDPTEGEIFRQDILLGEERKSGVEIMGDTACMFVTFSLKIY